jgi:sulfhydrogenase subunit gamma (sulfur reductase)
MAVWHEATVLGSHSETNELTSLTLSVGSAEFTRAARLPGQYVKIRLPDKGDAAFAIASAPQNDSSVLELLVKTGSELSDALVALPSGATVFVTLPAGPGFPLEKAFGKNVLLFATGSGISAIRAVIEGIRLNRSAFGDVTLYFGARSPSSFAYADELATWESSDIRVIRTVSQMGHSGWEGLTGHVQAHLDETPTQNAVAFLCGQPEMVAAVSDALVKNGLKRSDIYLNF